MHRTESTVADSSPRRVRSRGWRGPLLGLAVPVLLTTTLHLGCALEHPAYRACSITVRPLDATGTFLGPSQRISTLQAGLVAANGWSCAEPPTVAETTRRFESNLVGHLPALCADTSPPHAALRQLLCPPRVASWCQVASTGTCFAAEPVGGEPCSPPPALATLPVCPNMVVPGAPRLCMAPMGGVIDFGTVPSGVTWQQRVRLLNCGGGRLVAPPPSAVEASMTAQANFPPPVLGCSLTPAENAAMGAFLGAADRVECDLLLSFAAVGPQGMREAVFRYSVPGGDPVTFQLRGKVGPPRS